MDSLIAIKSCLERLQDMWDMMKAMTPEAMVGMAGSMVPEGFLESLNAKLTAIDK